LDRITVLKIPIYIILVVLVICSGSVLYAQIHSYESDFPNSNILWNVKKYTCADLFAQPVKSLLEIYFLQSAAALDYRTNFNSNRGFHHNYGEVPEKELNNTPYLFIKGGLCESNTVMLNGVMINSVMNGNSIPYISLHASEDIYYYEDVFPVEYGLANASLTEIYTRSGTSQYKGLLEIISDNLLSTGYDQNWYTASLGGPIPLLKQGYFFSLFEHRWMKDRQPSGICDNPRPGNWLDGWSTNNRLDYSPNSKLDLSVTLDASRQEWSEYRHEYLFNIEHIPYYKDDYLSFNVRMNHRISSKISYELQSSYCHSERFRGDGLYRENLFDYGRLSDYDLSDTSGYFMNWDDPETPIEYEDIWVVIDTMIMGDSIIYTDSIWNRFISTGDESAVWDDYLRHETVTYNVNGQIHYKSNVNTEILSGFEFNRYKLRYYRNYFPHKVWQSMSEGGFEYINRYGYDILGNRCDDSNWKIRPREPYILGGFVQAIHTEKGTTFFLGSRFDFFNYDHLKPKNIRSPLNPDSSDNNDPDYLDSDDLIEAESYLGISFRLGVTHKINNKVTMNINYGNYYQNSPYSNIFVGYDFFERIVSWSPLFFENLGTPDPEPLITTKATACINYANDNFLKLKLDLYYNRTQNVLSNSLQFAKIERYFYYRAVDKHTVKGIKAEAEYLLNQNIAFHMEYTYSIAEGFGPYLPPSWDYTHEPSPQTFPLDYAQRHKFVGIINFHFDQQNGSFPLANSLIDGIQGSLAIIASSGLRYTPSNRFNAIHTTGYIPIEIAPRNSAYLPGFFQIDLLLEKQFNVSGVEVIPFVQVKNLTDRKNITTVYQGTGKSDDCGWLDTKNGQEYLENSEDYLDDTGLNGEEKYLLRQNDPTFYSIPRMIYLGFKVEY
jgi:hypothetical protein